MIKQFIDNLRLPGTDLSAQRARRKACLLLGIMLGAATGFGFYFYGYVLAKIAAASIASFFLTTGISLALFTTVFTTIKNNIAKWIDDKPNPLTPVEITFEENPAKVERRAQLIKEITEFANHEVYEGNIKELKALFKELFSLRSYSTVVVDINTIEMCYIEKQLSFFDKIKKHEDWEDTLLRAEQVSLMVHNILYTDALLCRMEQHMREDNEPVNTKNIVAYLVDQGKRYFLDFMRVGVVNLYNAVRARPVTVEAESPWDGREPSHRTTYPQDRSFGNEFYEKNTAEEITRKLYNTFIKHGFYQRYGNQALKEALLLSYPDGDSRFESWTQKDSKRTKIFHTYPVARPI